MLLFISNALFVITNLSCVSCLQSVFSAFHGKFLQKRTVSVHGTRNSTNKLGQCCASSQVPWSAKSAGVPLHGSTAPSEYMSPFPRSFFTLKEKPEIRPGTFYCLMMFPHRNLCSVSNRPFQRCLLPPGQNESSYETIHMKMLPVAG